MFDSFKKNLYFYKIHLLFAKGLLDGKIVPFDEEFYDSMYNTFFNCIPISMHIKYLKPTVGPGQCYDRSLFMFFCFDDALLVRANVKHLEFRYGKDNARHGWIEIGDYVYDPSLLLRFERDLYYKIYNPTSVDKATKEDYINLDANYYYEVKNTKLDDFKIGGSKRTDLCITIPLVRGLAEHSGDENFKKELNDYLTLIQYDEKQVYEELTSNYVYSFKIK